MPSSIKKQIMDRLLSNLTALKTAGNFRSVTREQDPLKVTGQLPALMIYDADEVEVGKDNRGRSYQFPVGLKVLVQSTTDLCGAKDALVPLVQAAIEADIQLGGLAINVDGGSEHPFITAVGATEGGSMLLYTVDYRRVRGNPFQTY